MSRHLIPLSAFLGSLSLFSAPAASQEILLDQSSTSCTINSGRAMSTNFSVLVFLGGNTVSNVLNNTESADDFVVPDDERWSLTAVQAFGDIDLIGQDVRVRVYSDNSGSPENSPICDSIAVATAPEFGARKGLLEILAGLRVELPQACKLSAGRHWLSVQYTDARPLSECGGDNCPAWYWANQSSAPSSFQWMIRDPDETQAGVTCTAFGSATSCQSESVQRDLCFRLDGSSEREFAPSVSPSLLQLTVGPDEALNEDVSDLFIDTNADPISYMAQPALPDKLSLSNNLGVISGSVDNTLTGLDPIFSVVGTDSTGRSDIEGGLNVALRVVNSKTIEIPSPQSPDKVIRCGPASTSGFGRLTSTVDFSQPGSCAPYSAEACGQLDDNDRVINAWVETEVSHPKVSELTLSLTSPGGFNQVLLANPGVALNQDCDQADLNAVFSDFAPWPAQAQCASPIAIVGAVEPDQPLGNLRNLFGVGVQPWSLSITSTGLEPISLDRWCLALEVDRGGNEVFPQLDLPGSAQRVDLTNVSQTSVSASLTRADEVQWYQVVQESNSLQSVEAAVQTSGGLEVQIFRYGLDKRAGRNPERAAGTCLTGLPVMNRFMSPSGTEYFRVQGCPGSFVGDYTVTFTKVGLFYGAFPFELGRATGQVLDAQTGMPVTRAWLSADGGSSFTSPDGEFDVGITPGTVNLSIFHPQYVSTTLPPISIVQGETVSLPLIELQPTTYQAAPNQTVFVDGFE